MMNDSKARYGSITRFFHWSMAILVSWQFLKFFDRINDGEHWVGETLVPWHISIGSLLLVLIVLRLGWAVKEKGNRPEHESIIGVLAKIGHGLLYAALVLMPVTGICYMVGNGYGLSAFNFEIIAKSEEVSWLINIGNLHSYIAWGLLFLVAGHIGMAFIHQFIIKDGTLKRMM